MLDMSLSQLLEIAGKLTVIGVLVVWLYIERQTNKRLSKKNEEVEIKLSKAFDAHLADMKESNKDYLNYIEKFNSFANEMKDIFRNK